MYEHHGASQTRLYKIWCAMRERCYRETNESFARYGGRGITVCDEWRRSFIPFQRWALANGYASNRSIDRIDNDGNYNPGNCRWATVKTQARNRSEAINHMIVEYDGKRMNLLELSRATKIGYTTLRQRYKKGLRGDALTDTPKRQAQERLLAREEARIEQRNGNAALTDGQVVYIRNSKETGAELARRFKVSQAIISMIRTGKRRQDVSAA